LRKSTLLIMSIMLLAFGGMLVAANGVLGPMAKDAQVAHEVTKILEERGDLAEGAHVRAIRRPAGPKRLAKEGTGLVLQLPPSETVLHKKGELNALAMRAAREALLRHPARNLKWVEVMVLLPGEKEDAEPHLRTLVAIGPGERLLKPDPPLPEVWTK
jgi:hypothetical protein